MGLPRLVQVVRVVLVQAATRRLRFAEAAKRDAEAVANRHAEFVQEFQALAEGTLTHAAGHGTRKSFFLRTMQRLAFAPRRVADEVLSKIVCFGTVSRQSVARIRTRVAAALLSSCASRLDGALEEAKNWKRSSPEIQMHFGECCQWDETVMTAPVDFHTPVQATTQPNPGTP